MQIGAVGLLGAIDRFDPERGTRFASFARPSIIGELKRHFRDKTWATRVPRSLQEGSNEAVLTEAGLCQELGRAPSPAEIAERMGVDEDRALEFQAVARSHHSLSLDGPILHEDDEATLGDLIGEIDTRLDRLNELVTVRPALAELSEQDRLILYMRFCKDMRQREMAKDLAVSQMHVSRSIARILERLRSHVA